MLVAKLLIYLVDLYLGGLLRFTRMIHNTSLFYYPGTRFKEPQQGVFNSVQSYNGGEELLNLRQIRLLLLENLGRGVRGRNSSPGAWVKGNVPG